MIGEGVCGKRRDKKSNMRLTDERVTRYVSYRTAKYETEPEMKFVLFVSGGRLAPSSRKTKASEPVYRRRNLPLR